MKTLLVLQHVPHEDLGNLGLLLQSAGIQIDATDFSREPNAQPTLEGCVGLIVLGGPMGVYDSARYPHLATETNLIARAVKDHLPVLGICLGSQLIANALGARVYPSGIKEIGWYDLSPTPEAKDDPLFRHLGRPEKVFQWHGDTFELPHGAVLLASSQLCKNQAFRYGNNVYALQFHVEVDQPMIDHWLNVSENRQEMAGLNRELSASAIRAETPQHIERLRGLSKQVFGEFIRLF